ncbi:hypothetical protein [Streptomyces sp. NBC_00724]|uniref:hypothetical protein n=1 Tax=Streptomyces sp. NBC_00724 TaxID=2975812 RepID=UPI002ECFE449|nr:hypothetical protein OHB17_42560 [Streptomyces sp. NBC_00724]
MGEVVAPFGKDDEDPGTRRDLHRCSSHVSCPCRGGPQRVVVPTDPCEVKRSRVDGGEVGANEVVCRASQVSTSFEEVTGEATGEATVEGASADEVAFAGTGADEGAGEG